MSEIPGYREPSHQLRGAVLVLLGLLVLVAGWLGVRGLAAKRHLEVARPLVVQLQEQARAGDLEAAEDSLTALQAETGPAADLTSDVVWRAVSRLPVLGDDLSAVSALTATLDAVASDTLPQLVAVGATLDPAGLAPRGGRVDTAALARAREPLEAALVANGRARERLLPYADAPGLLSAVREPLRETDARLEELDGLLRTGARAARLVPPMLGAREPRTYLLLFQNLAEARSLGGIPGSFSVVRAEQGRLRIVAQGSASDIGRVDPAVPGLSPTARAVFGTQPERYLQGVTQVLDFPTAARLASAYWERESGQRVDGVVATDPVVLSYLLQATGPVPVEGAPALTADTVVAQTLNGVYLRESVPARQDEYFEAAASAAFEAVTTRAKRPAAALTGLARAAGEHRLLVWSADAAEQKDLSETVLAGVLPASEVSRPVVGAFLNDGTGSKMSYYLRERAVLTQDACRTDGLRSMRLDVTLTSTAPRSGLPDYVTGGGRFGVPPGTARNVIYLVSPVGGQVQRALVDGAVKPLSGAVLDGRAVAALSVDVGPGQVRRVTAEFLAPDLPGRARLRAQPGAVGPELVVVPSSCERHR